MSSLEDDPRVAALADLGKRPADLGKGYASDSEVYQETHRDLQRDGHSPQDINQAVASHGQEEKS